MNDKFEKVADSYSKLFYYSSYYTALAGLLEKYLGTARAVLEIGIADGIVAMAWDKLRRETGNSAPLKYYGIEPVARMVEIAGARIKEMSIKFVPALGDIGSGSQIMQERGVITLDGLVISRTLHEVFIQHNLDHDRLFLDLQNILDAFHPKVVVLGVVNRFVGLTEEETRRFIEEQVKEIGHGHDPAKEYVDQTLLDAFMLKQQYQIFEREKVNQPLKGFDPSPWGETITVYQLQN